MEMINATINNIAVTVTKGTTILEAARSIGIEIPTLCYLKELQTMGACRICVVEVEGMKNLVASCVYPLGEGMVVHTNTPRVFASRKADLELILSTHRRNCLSCVRSDNCELQQLCHDFKVDESYYDGYNDKTCFDDSAAHMYRDNSKCILCRRCVGACDQWQGVGWLPPLAAAFIPILLVLLSGTLARWPAFPVGNAWWFAPPVQLWKRIIPRMFGKPWPTPQNM